MDRAAAAFAKGYETSEEKKAECLYYSAVCHSVAQKSVDRKKKKWQEILLYQYLTLEIAAVKKTNPAVRIVDPDKIQQKAAQNALAQLQQATRIQ